jgi:hypothetical protein
MRQPKSFFVHVIRYGQDLGLVVSYFVQTYTRFFPPPSFRNVLVLHICLVECASVSACISSVLRQPCTIGLGTQVQSVRSSPGSVGGINGTLHCLRLGMPTPGLPNRVLGMPTPGMPNRVLGMPTPGMPEVFRCGVVADTARRLVLLRGVEYRSRRWRSNVAVVTIGSNGGEFPLGISNVAVVTIGSNGGEYPLGMPGPILGGGMVSGAVRSTVVTGCMMGY